MKKRKITFFTIIGTSIIITFVGLLIQQSISLKITAPKIQIEKRETITPSPASMIASEPTVLERIPPTFTLAPSTPTFVPIQTDSSTALTEVITLAGRKNPIWQIFFANAENWTFQNLNNELIIEDIVPTSINHEGGGTWAIIEMQQEINPLTDFELTFEYSWLSEDNSASAMQMINLWLLDRNRDVVAGGGHNDSWVLYGGRHEFYIGDRVKALEPGSDTFSGNSVLSVHRKGSNVRIFWNKKQMITGENQNPITIVEIEFKYYAFSDQNLRSHFGTETVKQLTIQDLSQTN